VENSLKIEPIGLKFLVCQLNGAPVKFLSNG
jgi:hypothetical protein